MEPVKVFNNVIIGQFVLTGVPVKVYVYSRYLTITDADDIDDPIYGFGMDEDGDMMQFDYREVDHLLVAGNRIDLETYNTGMGATEEPEGEEEEKEEEDDEEKKEEAKYDDFNEKAVKLGNILKEMSQDESVNEAEEFKKGTKIAIKSPKGRSHNVDMYIVKYTGDGYFYTDAGERSSKWIDEEDLMKLLKTKKAVVEGKLNEYHAFNQIKSNGYTFGVGDIVKNKNKSCPHHGSMGIVKKIMDLPDNTGTVAIYTVTNSGPTYKPGMSLTKTIDQLEPIQKPDAVTDDVNEKI